jgi:hypothetical protein
VFDQGCFAPADPFLWIAVYWFDKFRDGFRVEQLDELRMSYRLGPNEGWIAIKRNPVVFEIFDELPTDLADDAIREFARILEAGLYDTAVDILTGAAWPQRNVILPRLANVTYRHRLAFAKVLHARELDDLVVPGIDPFNRGTRN